MSQQAAHVVIVGGGFGGLYAAQTLAGQPVHVTLVDRRNYHLFQPLLYQVATAGLSPGEIAAPIRAILRRAPNVQVTMAEVTAIDVEARRVHLEHGALSYDYLILAPGSTHSYFGHDEWASDAPGLKTIEDALEIRKRILSAYELAERESNPAVRQALLTFAVVGGGPTGVELAGAIAEIARQTLRHDFRTIDPAQSRVVLIEAGPRILSGFPPDLSQSAVRQLEALGVQVRTNAMVTQITPDAVHIGDEVVPARTTMWAAGVAASPLAKSLGVALDRAGRVTVAPDLTLPGHPEVYVVGDLALFTHQPGWKGKPLPGVAPVAIQEGRSAARNILRTVAGEPRRAFRYFNRGNLATIGRAAGVGEVWKLHLSGLLAWVSWLVVHIYFLIGFENRLLVLIRWAWAYFSYQRGARLITNVVVTRPQVGSPAPRALPQTSAAAPDGQTPPH